MKEYLILLYIFISILLHLLVFYFVNFDDSKSTANKHRSNDPYHFTYIPKKTTNKDVLGKDRYVDLSKRSAIQLPKNELTDRREPENLVNKKMEQILDNLSIKKLEKRDVENREVVPQVKSIDKDNNIKSNMTVNENSKTDNHSKDTVVRKENIEPAKDAKNKPNIDKDTLSKIINPKDLIEEYAKKDKSEDLNFNSFEMKYESYFYKFRRQLYNVWQYPRAAGMRGEEGSAKIRFSILKDGTITNINVVESSGYQDLDKAAVEALKNMGKVPLSSSFNLEMLNVNGHFIYMLGGYVRIR